ncbi:MAG: FAD-binding domain-containing protein [Verrucomicrobiota bacterium]
MADEALSLVGERAEKFVQEVYWRSYWKGWLEMRPIMWRRYLDELEKVSDSDRQRAASVMNGESGVQIMDHFARELVETGYMHNHARMWFASFWVHVMRLPWQLGADFFFRHLLDGDAASNTLSWRWVAGLHTKGKNYLVRRSNIERYVDSEILKACSDGLKRLEDTKAYPIQETEAPVAPNPEAFSPTSLEEDNDADGLWIHEEDLVPETSVLGANHFKSVVVTAPQDIWRSLGFSEGRIAYQSSCLGDAHRRAKDHWNLETNVLETDSLAEDIAAWASKASLTRVITMRPFTGPLGDRLIKVSETLSTEGIELICLSRPEDAGLLPHATHGFFRFWKAVERDRLPARFSR